MITVLKNLMENDNSDLRTWAKVQFQKTLGEYYPPNKKQKKKPSTIGFFFYFLR